MHGWLHRLHWELYRAASRDFPHDPTTRTQHDTAREMHLAQTRLTVESLGTVMLGLAAHHNFKYVGPSAMFTFSIPLENIFRQDEDPTIHLQILSDKMYALLENLELTWELSRGIHDWEMPTQVLFDAIHETFSEIDSLFGWGGSLRRR